MVSLSVFTLGHLDHLLHNSYVNGVSLTEQNISLKHYQLTMLTKILIILGPFLTIEYFCLITEINTAAAGSRLQGYYETGL